MRSEGSIQGEVYPRDVFLSIFGVDPGAWTARGSRGETAMAFGLSRPAHTNEYGELDVFATTLTFFIAFFLKIDMKRAAGLVREHWRGWLDGLAETERPKVKGRGKYSEGICFVVACNPDKTKVVAKVGPCEEVFNELSSDDRLPFPLPLDLVLKQLRKDAKKAGVNPPKYLTPARPDTPEYAEWIADIEAYRRFAGARRTSRKKAKETA